MSDKYTVVSFNPTHLDGFVSQETFRLAPSIEDFLATEYKQSVAWTGLYGDQVLGCAGVFVKDGVGYAWAFMSPAVRDHAAFIHRTIRRYVRELLVVLPVSRLQAFAHAEFCRAGEWLYRLGFRETESVFVEGHTFQTFVIENHHG